MLLRQQRAEKREERPDFNYNLHSTSPQIASSPYILFLKRIISFLRTGRFCLKSCPHLERLEERVAATDQDVVIVSAGPELSPGLREVREV